uniref:Uncharacterized protein n=1 Tax=Rhizophora mucronata TaxID=61149 RepID=A0A2P2QB29_RHIMU
MVNSIEGFMRDGLYG